MQFRFKISNIFNHIENKLDKYTLRKKLVISCTHLAHMTLETIMQNAVEIFKTTSMVCIQQVFVVSTLFKSAIHLFPVGN